MFSFSFPPMHPLLTAYIDRLGLVISHLHISHNSPRLPPQNFAQKQRLLHRVWGQTICIMGDEQMANDMTYRSFSKKRVLDQTPADECNSG